MLTPERFRVSLRGMLRRIISISTLSFILVVALQFPSISEAKKRETARRGKPTVRCRMDFNLKTWAAFYKSGKGWGTIRCNNGQRSEVKIRTHGGGVTFGKSHIQDGRGTFTNVYDISEVYGKYVASEASAGASKSTGAQAMTKGDISLTLSGTGQGFDLGFSFGSFRISTK